MPSIYSLEKGFTKCAGRSRPTPAPTPVWRSCLPWEIGDEVIIPVAYGPLNRRLKAENEFRLTAAQLRAALTPRTKAVVLPLQPHRRYSGAG